MSDSVKDWLPGAAAQIEALGQTPLIAAINHSVWAFSVIQLGHLLSIAVLGGAVLVLNLRLLGLALPTVAPEDVERSTRPFMLASVAGTIVTGFLMTLATTQSSLTSTAFLIKMIALLAAIGLSVSVASSVRRPAGHARQAAKVLGVLATLVWLVAAGLFASASNLGPGVLLVAVAGFALFAAFLPSRRRAYGIGISLILLAGFGSTFLLAPTAAGDVLTEQVSIGTVLIGLAFAALLWASEMRHGKPLAVPPGRIGALGSTLAWVTVAAAGRWIGFS